MAISQAFVAASAIAKAISATANVVTQVDKCRLLINLNLK